MTKHLFLIVFATSGITTSIAAQGLAESRSRASLVRAIVDARREVMRDTTTLEGCHVRHFLGGPPDYRQRLDASTRKFVGECNGQPDSTTMDRPDVALLDSGSVTRSSATAYLTVYYGNLMYLQSMRFDSQAIGGLPPSAATVWKLRSASLEVSSVLRRAGGIPK
jgi:hypothetical protein